MVYYHWTNYCQYLIHFLSMEDPGFLGEHRKGWVCESFFNRNWMELERTVQMVVGLNLPIRTNEPVGVIRVFPKS